MFTYTEFALENNQVKLTLPDQKQADELFQAIEHDRQELSRWMPWTKTTTTVENEKKFINYAREQMSQDKLLELTIVVNGVAVGMADLHNIDWENRRAEVGYWLFSKYQGKGIMTATVKSLLRTAFNGWNLNKVIIQADSENQASQAVAKRLGFKQEAVLKEHLYQEQQFSDLVVYAKFASEWKNE